MFEASDFIASWQNDAKNIARHNKPRTLRFVNLIKGRYGILDSNG
jgi:hypothetical protein